MDAATTAPLSEAQPHQDLINLVTKRARFVESFMQVSQWSPWIVAKAIVGALLVRMLVAWVDQNNSEEWLEMAEGWMAQQSGGGFDATVLKNLQAQFAALGVLMSPLAFAFEMFWKIVGSLIFLYFLRPDDVARPNWLQLLVLYSYLSWLSVFSLIPWVGWLVTLILSFFWTVFAFEKIFKLSNFKAFLAAYGMGFVGLLLILGFSIGLAIAI